MNLALFYDTETTGLPLFDQPSEDPRQPHIVQLGAALVDIYSKQVVSSIDLIVEPRGWDIPDEVAKIHGITTDRAKRVGIPEEIAVSLLMKMWNARVRIGHNEQFDARILRIALLRYFADQVEPWKCGTAQCTQLLATPILKLPPTERMLAAGRNHFKSANLGEAYKYVTGRKLEGAHSAMVDVNACIDAWFAIKALSSAQRATN